MVMEDRTFAMTHHVHQLWCCKEVKVFSQSFACARCFARQLHSWRLSDTSENRRPRAITSSQAALTLSCRYVFLYGRSLCYVCGLCEYVCLDVCGSVSGAWYLSLAVCWLLLVDDFRWQCALLLLLVLLFVYWLILLIVCLLFAVGGQFFVWQSECLVCCVFVDGWCW